MNLHIRYKKMTAGLLTAALSFGVFSISPVQAATSLKLSKKTAKTGNQKNSNARSAKQVSGKANNGKILNTRTSSMRPDMARPEKNRK